MPTADENVHLTHGTFPPAVTLYSDGFWMSPWVFACFVALRHKGIAFEVQEVRLDGGEQRAPRFRAMSWTGRVPALAHGEFWLTESSAILEYVEETFPTPGRALFPADPQARARARQLQSWLRSDDTAAVRSERSSDTIFYDRPVLPLTEKGAACAAKAVALAERFLASSADSPAGPSEGHLFRAWSIADAELAFFLRRLFRDDAVLPPALRAYVERQWLQPSVAEFAGHRRRPFVQYGS